MLPFTIQPDDDAALGSSLSMSVSCRLLGPAVQWL